MSIFGAIKDAIFGHQAQATTMPTPEPIQAAPSAPATASPQPQVSPASAEDVNARLAQIAADKGAPSNYQNSIVDLMKLLNLDSSLANRQELARELGYTGDENDSGTMNVWLHGKVMESLANRGQ
jgi:hypothetical protein